MRVVSLVPSLSELVVHLGAGDALVGVTRWCVRPADLRSRAGVAVVGGTKDPDVAAIRSLRPDLVLANREENEREAVEALGSGIEVFVTDVRTVADAEAMVRKVGDRLGRSVEADELADRIRTAREEAAARTASSPRVPFLTLVWRKPWMAAGPDTYLSDLLETAGGRNVLASPEPRYPALETEAMRDLGPDAVVLPSEPYPFRGRHAPELAGIGLRTVLADGERLTWYGPLTPDGIRHAERVLRPA